MITALNAQKAYCFDFLFFMLLCKRNKSLSGFLTSYIAEKSKN
jgi:hypothetical protein